MKWLLECWWCAAVVFVVILAVVFAVMVYLYRRGLEELSREDRPDLDME